MPLLKNKTQEAIEYYIPFAGKIVVAELNAIDDVAGWIKTNVDDLRDWVVDSVEQGQEVIEEVLSWANIGDGADEPSHPAVWQEPKAYRSYRSGQSLAARRLERDLNKDRVTFLAFGRTGSGIKSGLLGPRTIDEVFSENVSIDRWARNRGQVQEVKEAVGPRRIDVLIISIGLNDLGFSSLVTKSILKASGTKRKQRIAGTRKYLEEDFLNDLLALKNAVDSQVNPRHVCITEYPVGIFKEIADGAEPCGVLGSMIPNPVTMEGLNLDESDAIDLGGLGRILNDTLRAKAKSFGWTLIDGIESGFDGHGYCARESYFVFAEDSCLLQGDFEGMLHPNQKGHEVVRDCIASALVPKLKFRQTRWLEPVLSVMMR